MGQGEKIKLGSWQGRISENDVPANTARLLAALESSRGLGLDFLCFPETFLTGITPAAVQESSLSLDGPEIASLLKATAQYDTVVLAGLSERKGGRFYNTQAVMYRGQLLGCSRKTMLTEDDAAVFSTDLELPVYEAKGIRFGVVTCHSSSFVEPALYLRWKGARLLFTPHYNNIPPEGFDADGTRVTFSAHREMVLNNQAALATLLKMVVVRSNIVAVEENGLGAGDSNIWDMDGRLVAAGVPFTECVVHAEFDTEIFQREHWIDRREVPARLCEMIAEAARGYPR